MNLPDAVAPYLAQVADDKLTTLAQLQDALNALQRSASVVSARLGLELSELDTAHHEIVARVIVANHRVNDAANDKGQQQAAIVAGAERRAENLIENCVQRSRFVNERLAALAQLVAQIRRGITELQNDQAQLRSASDAA